MTHANPSGTSVATAAPGTLEDLFEKGRKYVEAILPPGWTMERLVATVRLEFEKDKTGKLRQCTGSSILRSVARILNRRLEIGVTAFLVPFNNKHGNEWRLECQDILGYQGLCQLMLQSGIVRTVEARCVYEGDSFEYQHGLNPKLEHRPVRDVRKRGAMIGAYCVIGLPFQRFVFEFLPLADIDEVRKKFSKQWKDGECPPWYAKKRAIIYTSKTMPKSPELQGFLNVVEEDDRAEGIEEGTVTDVSHMEEERPQAAGAANMAISAPDPTTAAPAAQRQPEFAREFTDDELMEQDERRFQS